ILGGVRGPLPIRIAQPVSAADTAAGDSVLRKTAGGQRDELPEDLARVPGAVPGRALVLERASAGALAGRVSVPALRAPQELPDRRAASGAVPELSLSGFRDRGNDLPQDPSPAAGLVPCDLLRCAAPAGDLGAPVSAR